MKNYFYTDGTTKFGPVTLEELKDKRITRDTSVWFQGLPDWKPAGEVAELSELFNLTPPPVTESRSEIKEPCPDNWLVVSILTTVLCCMPLGIIGIINASNVTSRYANGDIEGAKRAAKNAKIWSLLGIGLTVAGVVLYFLFIIFFIGVAGSEGAFDELLNGL